MAIVISAATLTEMALAMQTEADRFEMPADLYIEPEGAYRLGHEAYEHLRYDQVVDLKLEGYRILIRAALTKLPGVVFE